MNPLLSARNLTPTSTAPESFELGPGVVVSVQMLHPLQSAPVILISSDSMQSIAKATPKIIDLFDPHHPTAADPGGYAYEGYFLVAQTTNGVPYLATFNHWRPPHVGGGEWAATESLYPFAHG